MKKLLVSIAVVLFLVCAADAAQPKISPDRINTSQPFPSITMDEGANITLDGGFVKSFQSEWTFNPAVYGATGDDYTDDAEAIQDCIDAAYGFYQDTLIEPTVEFPPGRFFANTSQTHYDNYGILIEPRPHIKYKGAGIGKTILQAKDNYRNATVGCYLFWNEDEYMPNFQVSDITFEYGNNTVQLGENNYTAIGAAITSDVLVTDCEFRNVSGTWALMLGLSGANRGLCKNAIVCGIIVKEVAGAISGDQTYDHTSIRFNMDNVVFTDSILKSTSYAYQSAGFEFHGNDSIAKNIQVENYLWGCHLGADQDVVCTASGQVVDDCIFRTGSGIGIWSFPAGSALKDFTANRNEIYIINENPLTYGAGLMTHTVTGSVKNITLRGNVIIDTVNDAYTTSIGAYLANVESLIYTDNIVRNCSNGIKVESTEDITYYDVSRNDIIDWGHGVVNGQHSSGIYLDIRPSVLSGWCDVQDNRLVGDGHPEYGILTYTPNLEKLNIVNNNVGGVNTTDIITFIPGGYADEKTYIRHTSRTGSPSGTYLFAINGSSWLDTTNGKLYRRAVDATSWKEVNWTYV